MSQNCFRVESLAKSNYIYLTTTSRNISFIKNLRFIRLWILSSLHAQCVNRQGHLKGSNIYKPV